MSAFAVSVIVAGLSLSANPDPAQVTNAAARAAMRKYEAEVKKIEAQRARDLEAARTALDDALADALKEVMGQGNLQQANAIEGMRKGLKAAAGNITPFSLAGTVWKIDGNAQPPFWAFDAAGSINNGKEGRAIPISSTQFVRMSDWGVLMVFSIESPTKAKGVWLKSSGTEHVFTRVK